MQYAVYHMIDIDRPVWSIRSQGASVTRIVSAAINFYKYDLWIETDLLASTIRDTQGGSGVPTLFH